MMITKQSLDRFAKDLKFRLDLFKQFRNEADKYLASDFNVFNWIQPDENQFSDIFAFLLDKDQTHAQGSVFLDEFLIALGFTSLASRDFKVSQEKVIGNGRIDILLENDDHIIIVENKPFATDLDEQISRYIKEYEHKDYYVVYLSGDGSNPSKNSLSGNKLRRLTENNKFKKLNYNSSNSKSLVSWLTTCHQKCQADRLRWLISDLKNYINEKFIDEGGEEDYVKNAQ